MVRYIIKRIFMMIPVILGVVTIVFIINALTPGDPARQIAGTSASEAEIAAVRDELGLNKPIIVRYGIYLKNLITKGDLGTSFVTKEPVINEIATRFPTTLQLAINCVLLSTIVGVPLGIVSSVKRYSIVDNISMSFALFGVSVPAFWLGLMLIMLFAVNLGWLPAFGVSSVKKLDSSDHFTQCRIDGSDCADNAFEHARGGQQ